MKNLDIMMLILAILVIGMFSGVGIALSIGNVWLLVLFLLLGFGFMGSGFWLKRKRK